MTDLVQGLKKNAKDELDRVLDTKWWYSHSDAPRIEQMTSWKAADRIETLEAELTRWREAGKPFVSVGRQISKSGKIGPYERVAIRSIYLRRIAALVEGK